MGSIFESGMLICFGFSWPLNVIKAYKARSAKGTSLAFILLIITGYIAGITAKFINHQINYVLAVYFLNLVIVLINLFVYFRNRKLDRENEGETMIKKVENSDSVVLFGGNIDKEIPVAEIAQDYELNFKMFNRSTYGLSLTTAKENFTKQIEPLNPESVIIHIGQDDLDMFNKNSADFDIRYIDLINFIKEKNQNVRIALVSNNDVYNASAYTEMNRHIKAIADSEQCTYINIENAKLWNPEATKELMAFMYDVGFDQPLHIKKPIGNIAEIIFSYAYQNGILMHAESQAV